MTREDPCLDWLHDGIEPTQSATLGDQAELEAEHDRLSCHSDFGFADWYALGAARVGSPGSLEALGGVAAPISSPWGSDQPSTGGER